MTSPTPGPAPLPPAPTPGCSYPGCTNQPLVQWQRRPTNAELAPIVAAEQARRDEVRTMADPRQSPPVFRPMPGAKDTCISVFGCNSHAISMDLAARIHSPNCTAPDPAVLPGCNCTPEPLPPPEPMHAPVLPLPDHWQ